MTSIQRHLTLRVVGCTLALFSAAGAGLYYYVQATLVKQLDAAVMAKARVLASLVKQEWKDGAVRLEFEWTEPGAADPGVTPRGEFYQIQREDGSVVASSPRLGGARLTDGEKHTRAHNIILPDGRRGRAVIIHFLPRVDREMDEEDVRDYPAMPKAQPLDLTLARDRAEVDRPLRVLLTALVSALAAVGLATAFVVAWTIRRGLHPLRGVADSAASIDTSSLDYRFNVSAMPAELAPICARLNDLLARLDQAFQRERRFSADVAHELRTPIAELRSLAEVALKYPDATASCSADDALAIARQMESIVTALLSLARCEAGRQNVAKEELDLVELVREVWKPLAQRATDRGLRVEMAALPPAPLSSDKALLTSILGNLLDNALTYAPPGGRIACAVEDGEGGYTLRLGNEVHGLSAGDVAHFCEPFWRKDPARSDQEHSGLGLALVAAFARLLGATLRLELARADWLEVTLSLPK